MMDKKADDRMRDAVKAAVGMGIGWATIAFAANRIAAMSQTRKRGKDEKALIADLNARMPIISPDPYLDDPDMNEERRAGLHKRAEETVLRRIMDRFVNPFVGWGAKDQSMLRPAMAGAGVVGGITLGTLLARRMQADKDRRELEARIDAARQQLDQEAYEIYAETRGIDKTAWSRDTISRAFRSAGAAIPVWAVGSATAAFLVASAYLNSIDENRKAVKGIQRLARQRAIEAPPPVLMTLPPPLREAERRKREQENAVALGDPKPSEVSATLRKAMRDHQENPEASLI
jgi:hypothetical protein